VYLDTTYGHPKHLFLPQHESIAAIVDIVKVRPHDAHAALARHQQEENEQVPAAFCGILPCAHMFCTARGLLMLCVQEALAQPGGADGTTPEAGGDSCAAGVAGGSSGSSGGRCLVLLSAYNIGKVRVP
jgi:hypothetical protein